MASNPTSATTVQDTPDPWRVQALAAALDHADPPWPAGELPPLGHWLCFRPLVLASETGPDGHPNSLGEIADVAGLRRMWASSEISFDAPIRLGQALERQSSVASVERKAGRTGPLVFLTLEHELRSAGTPVLRERQHIVYREPSCAGSPSPDPAPEGVWQRDIEPDSVLLLRYSALTFNSHRIHYDLAYATGVERYPGLVVHGPLTATLLMDLFLRSSPGAHVSAFAFRARRPLFAGNPLRLYGRPTSQGAELWAVDHGNNVAMTATVEAA